MRGRRPLIALLITLFLVGCDRAPAGPPPLFADEFIPGQMGQWQIEGDASGQTAVVDEQLLIDINAPQTIQFATLLSPQFADFILEVDARQLRGDLQSSFGVLFRMQSPTEFYRFEITGNGFYMLERRNGDGTWTRFVDDWTPSPAINQGINAINRLRVEAAGRNISIYVNDILLHQASDNAYIGGTIALDAGTFIAPELRVAFDNMVVRQP